MSKKNLLIIAVLLIAVAAFVQLYSKKEKRQDDTPIGKPIASTDLIEAIDEIVIMRDKDAVHLQKRTKSWIVVDKNGFPADTPKLVGLLDNITSYRIASLITRDENRLADFQLQGKDASEGQGRSGTHLQLKSKGKNLFTMIIGKNRDSVSNAANRPARPDGTYIRVDGTPSVYLIKENFSVDTKADDWINKVLVNISKEKVKTIRFESPASRFAFSREESKSDLTLADLGKSETLDKEALTDLLKELSEFKIEAALPIGSKLEKSLQLKSEIAVSMFDDSSLDFQILSKSEKNPLADKKAEKEDSTYYVKLINAASPDGNANWQQLSELGSQWLFELDEWQAKNWLKTRKDFIQTTKK